MSSVSFPTCCRVQRRTRLVLSIGNPRLEARHTPPPPARVSTVAAARVRSFWYTSLATVNCPAVRSTANAESKVR